MPTPTQAQLSKNLSMRVTMLCPNCKNERDRQEPIVVRGIGVEVCSICVERILWNEREAQPDAVLDAAVVLANSLIDGSAQEIWKVTERGRHRHGRPRKEVLDILFVGLVAAMIGEGVEATLKRIDPTCVSGPISSRTVTRELASPAFLPVLRIAYEGSIELAVKEARSPKAIAVDPASDPDELIAQLAGVLKVPMGGWKTSSGRLAKLLCMATGHNLKLFDAHVDSGESWSAQVAIPDPPAPSVGTPQSRSEREKASQRLGHGKQQRYHADAKAHGLIHAPTFAQGERVRWRGRWATVVSHTKYKVNVLVDGGPRWTSSVYPCLLERAQPKPAPPSTDDPIPAIMLL